MDFQRSASVGVGSRKAKMEKKKVISLQGTPDMHPCPTRYRAPSANLPGTAGLGVSHSLTSPRDALWQESSLPEQMIESHQNLP